MGGVGPTCGPLSKNLRFPQYFARFSHSSWFDFYSKVVSKAGREGGSGPPQGDFLSQDDSKGRKGEREGKRGPLHGDFLSQGCSKGKEGGREGESGRTAIFYPKVVPKAGRREGGREG